MNDIYPLTLLYDGDCAICRFEVASLERRDTLRRLRFVDIAAPGFDARRWGRRNGFARFPSAAELDARIHAVTAGHEILIGVDVFRHAWRAVGLGALAAPLGWRLLRPLAERGYLAFARHRHALSRRLRPMFDTITPRNDERCANGACHPYRRGN
jgi:predicted DCC family thiol-disulfide oxidoreductase YuxK